MKTTIRRIRKGLRGHPGWPFALLWSVVGLLAGFDRGSVVDALVGGLLMSVFWLPVIATAYKTGAADEAEESEEGAA